MIVSFWTCFTSAVCGIKTKIHASNKGCRHARSEITSLLYCSSYGRIAFIDVSIKISINLSTKVIRENIYEKT